MTYVPTSIVIVLVFIAAFCTAAPFIHAEDLLEGGDKTQSQAAPKGFVPLSDANFQDIFGISGSSGGSSGSSDLGTFVNSAFRVALSLGAILAVMRIAWAGYKYMTTDAWGTKSDAREILGDVMIGLLLLLSIWLILYQINPDILKIKLHMITSSPSSVGSQTGQTGSPACDPVLGCP